MAVVSAPLLLSLGDSTFARGGPSCKNGAVYKKGAKIEVIFAPCCVSWPEGREA
jgi:hypothetical protein